MSAARPLGLFTKDPTAILDYSIDWSQWLDQNGDVITGSAWAVTSPAGDASPMTAGSATFSASTSTVWLSAGTAGNSYDIKNTITTRGGRTEARSIRVTAISK